MKRVVLATLTIVLSLAMAGCSGSGQMPLSGSGQTQSGALYGSPWVTGIFTGNLPSKAPRASDDLYLHYGFDYIASHQDASGYCSVTSDASDELQQFVTSAIKGEGAAAGELTQLRIFYDQAADLDALAAAGADGVRPYLKAVADATSLKELEAVLLSPDFPFSPWIDVTVSAADMKSTMCAQIMPHMLFADNTTSADVYKDGADASASSAYSALRAEKTAQVQEGLMLVSLASDATQAAETTETYFQLEKTYGRLCMPKTEGLDAEYGAFARQLKVYSANELAASCPNFPIADTMEKLGKGAGEGVIVTYPEWLTAFNNVWTEENFELLRGMTELKVLCECAPYLAPSYFSGARKRLGQAEPSADENAWAACDTTATFSQ